VADDSPGMNELAKLVEEGLKVRTWLPPGKIEENTN
jgi:hypothetical protein